MKKTGFIPLILIILLILFPKMAMNGAAQGLKLWSNTVFPTLYPFAVLSGMLVSSGMLKNTEKLFYPIVRHVNLPQSSCQAVAVGIVSGYPMGAVTAKELFKCDRLNGDDVELTATISSFCSPMFIVGSVGVGMLGNSKYGIAILISHYIAYGITLFVWSMFTKKQKHKIENKNMPYNCESFGTMLKNSVDRASSALISVCGYIVLFSVIKCFIEYISVSDTVVTVITSVMEVSGGCAKIAESGFSDNVKTALSAFAVSWGGMCVIMQISGFVSECGGKNSRILLFKFMHGVISAFVAYCIVSVFTFC